MGLVIVGHLYIWYKFVTAHTQSHKHTQIYNIYIYTYITKVSRSVVWRVLDVV